MYMDAQAGSWRARYPLSVEWLVVDPPVEETKGIHR